LLQAWDGIEPLPYRAGSWGPAEADALLSGRRWQIPATAKLEA
jgi:glucose-6-phosphate 1-dehydrogenase